MNHQSQPMLLHEAQRESVTIIPLKLLLKCRQALQIDGVRREIGMFLLNARIFCEHTVLRIVFQQTETPCVLQPLGYRGAWCDQTDSNYFTLFAFFGSVSQKSRGKMVDTASSSSLLTYLTKTGWTAL